MSELLTNKELFAMETLQKMAESLGKGSGSPTPPPPLPSPPQHLTNGSHDSNGLPASPDPQSPADDLHLKTYKNTSSPPPSPCLSPKTLPTSSSSSSSSPATTAPKDITTSTASCPSPKDGEMFDGKIVYNPDGSAYIIEGGDSSDLSDGELTEEGIIVDYKNKRSPLPACPQIASAFYIHRNPATALYSSWLNMLPADSRPRSEDPIMHSYRVYDLRTGKKEDKENKDDNAALSSTDSSPVVNLHSGDVTSVPTKPVLMCFICKLSFGFAKSFTNHASSEHSMELSEDENEIMSRKNSSAIIQGIGKNKEPLMSFLEPVLPPSKTKALPVASILKSTRSPQPSSGTNVSYVHTATKVSSLEHKSDATSSPSSSSPSNGCSTTTSTTTTFHGATLQQASSPALNTSTDSTAPATSPHNLSDLQNNNINAQKDKVEESSSSSPQATSPLSSPSSLTTSPVSTTDSCAPSMPPIQGIVIRSGCEDHPNGNITGEDCYKCDSKLGHVPHPNQLMHSRNSCKTLKCPKCNWHYKYQETLEIHMKEKHPENDAQCLYCMTSQPHPRLARGEVYTCGYKPYRCEVCNYSTTTKGNLSIHMQSDKHINNMQELQQQVQQGGDKIAVSQPIAAPAPTTPPQSTVSTASATASLPVATPGSASAPSSSSSSSAMDMMVHDAAAVSAAKANKPKPSWRCDVCNYETNVARNLRIHMTSEKHTHNMMVLQQNVKHMQRDMQYQYSQLSQMAMLDQATAAAAMMAGMNPHGPPQPLPPHSHSAAAAAASLQQHLAAAAAAGFDPATAMMLGGGGMMPPGFPPPLPGAMDSYAAAAAAMNAEQVAKAEQQLQQQQQQQQQQQNGMTDRGGEPNHLYQCAICEVYYTDSVDAMHAHMQMDRTKSGNEDHVQNVGGINMCQLCQYKTNLKANFQLHCKTDKHLQRLQLVNHIREGGPNTEWRLKYMANISNPVQVRCNPCDFCTNSIHKLQLHTTNARHDATAKLFAHLRSSEARLSAGGGGAAKKCYYHCSVCAHHARSKFALLHHVRSMKHMRHESVRLMQLKEAGRQHEYVMDNIFTVHAIDDDTDIQFDEDDDVNENDETNAAETDSVATDNNKPDSNKSGDDSKDGNMQLKPGSTSGEAVHMCPYCNYSSVNELRIKAHIQSQHVEHCASTSSSPARSLLACPLCQEKSAQKSALEKHLMQVHSVSREGLQKLMMLVEPVAESPPPPPAASPTPDTESVDPVAEMLESQALKMAEEASMDGVILSDDKASPSASDDIANLRCQTCSQTFPGLDALYAHQNELGHLELKQTPRGPGYLCWKKGCNQYFKTATTLQMHFREIHMRPSSSSSSSGRSQHVSVSEKHVYKYRCVHCSLAFKSMEKLQLHSYYHMIRSATKCLVCGRGFRSIAAMRKHVEASHLDQMSQQELDKYKESLAVSTQLGLLMPPNMPHIPGLTPTPNPTPAENGDRNEKMEVDTESQGPSEEDGPEESINTKALAENSYQDPNCKYKCVRCKVAFTSQKLLAQHNKTQMHRRGDKASLVQSPASSAPPTVPTYTLEKFNDPNRPFKCDICKESFTQKNILLVHYNSVSHLHKVKQQQQENGGSECTAASSSSPATTVTPTASPAPQASSTPKPSTAPSSPTKEEAKPYKCNICKVSYSQSSTLDIHMRSVLHQTKASKLPELALSGEVDINKPLIEQPELDAQSQFFFQQQMLAAAMSAGFLPQPFMVPNSTAALPSSKFITSQPLSMSKPVTSTSTSSAQQPSTTTTTVTSSSPVPAASSSSATTSEEPTPATTPSASGPPFVCSKCANTYASQEELVVHQQMYCYVSYRFKPQVQRNLLENIGFECVMQYNEYPQRVKKKDDTAAATDHGKEKAVKEDNNDKDSEADDKEAQKKSVQSEYEKCPCEMCGKQFSSIWVLKAHQEEVHKQVVPLNYVEDFGKQFKDEFEKKYASQNPEMPPPTEAPNSTASSTVTTASSDATSASNKEASTEDDTPSGMAQMQGLQTDLAAAQQMAQMMQMPAMFGMMPGMMPGLPFPMPMGMNMMPPLMPGMMPGMPELMGMPGLMDFPPMPPNMAAAAASAAASQQSQQQPQQQQQQQQQQAQQAAAAAALINQAKRPRTRINDEQLKILRAHFDINNSPSEEQILKMSEQSGLPAKVIKHWFRNTLFKERQRNKDSPYNFSIPPSTQINLEEYEKTGTIRMQQVEEKIKAEQAAAQEAAQAAILAQQGHIREPDAASTNTPPPTSTPPVKSEPKEDRDDVESLSSSVGDSFMSSTPSTPAPHTPAPPVSLPPGLGLPGLGIPPPNMVASHADITAALARVLSNPENKPAGPPMMPHSTPMSLDLSSSSMNMSYSTPSTPTTPASMASAGGQGSASHMSKRANRTRFTDYQLKILQEYFEQNAYPKDDDLDHMSKMLNLSPRVIVVWFQNARQKARKNYENNPPMGLQDEESRFNRTPGLNYQCKRCHTVFQRYYELIRHQKTQCYKDEPNHPNVSSAAEDSNSSSYTAPLPTSASSETPRSEARKAEEANSTPTHQPLLSQKPETTPQPVVIKPEPDTREFEEEKREKETVYKCEKCPAKFPRFDLWKEHQTVHLMNPSLFSPFPPDSAFAMLQNVGSQPGAPNRPASQPQTPSSSALTSFKKEESAVFPSLMESFSPLHSSSPASQAHDHHHNPLKRKAEEEVYTMDAQGQKRMRTTILPEQLDYLYQQYQNDCNPSRKQIEQIAGSVGLKKRVVQVWYQNTRARERKGQFRAHMQIIHKRCPVCRALFRAKSALESHLATKHPERMAKGDINIDALPDEPLESLGFTPPPPPGCTSPNSVAPGLPLDMARLLNNPYNMPGFMVPPPGPPHVDTLHLSMKKLYEDSLKKYLDDLSAGGAQQKSGQDSRQSKSPAVSSSGGGQEDSEEAPLDLSKPLREESLNMSSDSGRRMSMDDSISETYSESAESHNDDGVIMTDYYPSSPNTKAPTAVGTSTPASHNNSQMPHKRYRTQMNSLQIKVMKAMFVDYKTPTMAECELLGREIGLAKRVVQVWFQNARAKEKKAKLNYANTFNMEVDFHRPPEECKVCNFTYSHKYTIQDHIFTKNHIARLRSTMMAQGDSGTESSYPDFKDPIVIRPVTGGGGDGGDSSSGKPWGSDSTDSTVVSHPHLAQLHAMGLQAMASDQGTKNKDNADPNKNDKKANSRAKTQTSTSSSSSSVVSSLAGGMFGGEAAVSSSAGMMPPFMMPGMMPPLMPPPPPHMAAGGSEMMMYDPTLFGTPLPMLQIPAGAIHSIQSKLATAGCLITRYTQDCQDLPTHLAAHVHTLMVDVGYICRKCHMVFPHRPACVNHQQLFCYQGNSAAAAEAGSIIKLEQIQYRCSTCRDADKFSSVAQVQAHIEDERHQRAGQQPTEDSTRSDSAPHTPGESDPARSPASAKAQTPPPSSSSSSPPSS